MADEKEPQDSAASKADTLALIAEAEAEAAEAEALAAAARARARAARLRREALAEAEAEAEQQAEQAAEAAAAAAATDEDATATDEAESDDDVVDTDEDAVDAADGQTEDDPTATDDEVFDETPEEAESESKPARSWRPSLSVTWKAAAVILICAFVGASGYMMWQRHEITERNQRIANFVAGARQGVVNITSLDFNRAKEDVQRVIDGSTGQFRDDFQQRAKDFTTVVEQSKVVTEGTVTAAALQSIDGNSGLVLVAATSRITNAAGAKDEPRRWRLRVTVTEDGGQYKVSKLEFIP
jgi:Mce-associated membrane protein